MVYYYSLSQFLIDRFGEKLYKLSIDAGMGCPNRDGTIGVGGCVFCSEKGSGDFAASGADIDSLLNAAKKRVEKKSHSERYIAYFQAYTNTYAPVNRLRELYTSAIRREDIAVLSIATRPDCLGEDVLSLLEEIHKIKPVWVELGFQTSKPESVSYINRGYDNEVFTHAIARLRQIGIHTVVHMIIGLPGESRQDMLNTARYIADSGADGVKLQLLHVLKGTPLAQDYAEGKFKTLEIDEYISLLEAIIPVLPAKTVIHRLTGDGDKRLLIAPMWSADKKTVLNAVGKRIQPGKTILEK